MGVDDAVEGTNSYSNGVEDCHKRPCVILFYKYHPLSDDPSIVELYRTALQTFCQSLSLKGRILVGCSEHRSEGINGTLSGTKANLRVFVKALGGSSTQHSKAREEPIVEIENAAVAESALLQFKDDCQTFYRAAKCPPLEMEEAEFKWSEIGENEKEVIHQDQLFPDLNIKIVNELIGTGGVLSSIKIDDLHKGYLTPTEWHERIAKLQAAAKDGNINDEEGDTVLIDCRNTKECAIGNFVGSIDPQTTTFNQFPKWVDDHKHKIRNKNVLMYCTGGIRCEKASAYVRQAMGDSVKEVRHLKGGIHKYLEAYGGESKDNDAIEQSFNNDELSNTKTPSSLWRGKNFVFDGRGAHGPEGGDLSSENAKAASSSGTNNASVGACRYCEAPYDSFDPHCVCTVCKEPILVCKTCQEAPSQRQQPGDAMASNRPQYYREYHCVAHKHLQHCYFTNLELFSFSDLEEQLVELAALAKEIAVGKKFRQRRKTLAKQCAKIEARLKTKRISSPENDISGCDHRHEGIELKCRNCGQPGCSGKCWGFHGLKRKRVLEQREEDQQQHGNDFLASAKAASTTNNASVKPKNAQNERLKQEKERQKQKQIDEWIASGLTKGPSVGRDPLTGLRVPNPCVRVLETTTKGKWCGRSLLQVLKTEFQNSWQPQGSTHQSHSSQSNESQAEDTLRELLKRNLIRVNATPITSLDGANSYKLRNMDVIDRITLWHEPPIYLPSETIHVQKIPIPEDLIVASAKKSKNEACAVVDNNIYVCNKPSTVPVHPAGPYLSNSLTMLVEAQEGLRPKTLIPCHRIDRVTSGMTICCDDPRVARLIQTTMAAKSSATSSISKQYLAKVVGRFPLHENDTMATIKPNPSIDGIASWEWMADDSVTMVSKDDGLHSKNSIGFVKVEAPIETTDPLNGIRKITPQGKASTSLFRLVEYDAASDTSIIVCVPVTGRSHQLRVHLEWLGHSIVDDVQYGYARGDGGRIMDGTKLDPSSGIDRMVNNVREYNSRGNNVFRPSGITAEQMRDSRDVCPVCDLERRGPAYAFSPSQLLQGGHAICLHAHRYSLSFPAKHCSDPTGLRVDLEVDLPPWAMHLRGNS